MVRVLNKGFGYLLEPHKQVSRYATRGCLPLPLSCFTIHKETKGASSLFFFTVLSILLHCVSRCHPLSQTKHRSELLTAGCSLGTSTLDGEAVSRVHRLSSALSSISSPRPASIRFLRLHTATAVRCCLHQLPTDFLFTRFLSFWNTTTRFMWQPISRGKYNF